MADAIWIPVNAQMKGFIGTIVKEASGAGKRGAQVVEKEFSDGGKRAGKALADGLSSQAKRVEQISTKLGTARKAEASAAADVATAEQKLNSLRKQGDVAASKISQAEQQLATAKSKQADASARVQREEQSLADVRKGGQGASNVLSRAEDALATARTSQGTAMDKVRTAEFQLSEARDKAKTRAATVQHAEKNLISVRAEFGASSKQAASAEKQLETAKRQAETANAAVARSEGNLAKARANLASATDTVKAKAMTHKAAQHDVAAAEKRAGAEAQSAGAKIRSMGGDMSSAASSGGGFAMSLGGFAKKAALAGGAFLGVSSATSALSAGFDRLNNLQRADIMFKNIGLSADQTKAQMSDINDVITGTSVSMADAASTASMLMQAGVEAGKPLNESIKALTNISAIAGGSAQDVGMVLMQIKAAGKLMGGDAMQLQGRGVNIYGYLAESLGKSFEEVKKMGEDGKITYEMVIDAINEKTGDLATEMGETLPAKMGNFKTAVASLAASAIEPLIAPATKAVSALTSGLKKVTPVVKEFVEKAVNGIGDFFAMAGRNKGVVVGLGVAFGSLAVGMAAYTAQAKIAAAGGLVGMFTKLGKAVKGAAGAQWLLNGAMWANPVTWIAAGIAAAAAALYLFFTKTESGRKAWSALVEKLKVGWSWLKGVFIAGWDAAVATFDKVKTKFVEVRDALFGEGKPGTTFIDSVVDKAKDFWEWMGKVKDLATGVYDALFKGEATSMPFGIEEDSMIMGVFLSLHDAAINLRDALVSAWDSARDAWEKMSTALQEKWDQNIQPMVDALREKWREAVDTVRPAIDKLREKWAEFTTDLQAKYDEHVKPAIDSIKEKIGELQDKLGELVQKYWEPVIKPALMLLAALLIGPVVLGLGAVVVAVGGVIAILGGLAYVLLSLPGWVMSAVEGAKKWFSDMKDKVVAWFTEMGQNISSWWSEHVQTIPGRVSEAVSGALDKFREMWDSVKKWFSDMGKSVSNFWANHVKPLPGKVGDSIGQMMSKLRELPGKIKSVFADAGRWLLDAGKNIIRGLIDGIKSMGSAVGDAIKSVVPDWVPGLGNAMGGVIMADGGVTRAYVDGGITALESYANGGARGVQGKLPRTATLQRPHGVRGLVQWAEASTMGEFLLPISQLIRQTPRAMALLARAAHLAGAVVLDRKTGQQMGQEYSGSLGSQQVGIAAFADGGVTAADLKKFVQGSSVNGSTPSRPLEGAPYVWGGSNWGDCSGTASAVAALAAGVAAFPRKFATGSEASWLSSHGFKRGKGKAGDLRIGFRNGGAAGGHTSGTLPDGTNFEMGGARGNGQVGGGAAGAHDSYYNEFFYKTVVDPKEEERKLRASATLNPFADMGIGADGAYTFDGIKEFETADGQRLELTADQLRAAQVLPSAEKWAAGDQSARGDVETGLRAAGRIGSQAAAATFAEELGNKSMVELGADALFGFLGMQDSLTKKALFTPVGDLLGVKDAATGSPGTSKAAKSAAANHDAAVTSMTPAQLKADPQLRNAPDGVMKQPDVPKWGQGFFVHEIARSAKAKGVGNAGAIIGVATALVESGDPMKMWANKAVPESLKHRYDALGSDHDSVGLFQQRNNGAWGTTADRMDPFRSAGMFFDAMLRKFPSWQSMEPGKVAQGVQVSAFPDRYATKMGKAKQLVDATQVATTKAKAPNKAKSPSTLSAAVEEVTKTWDGIDWGYGAHEELVGDKLAKSFLDKVEAVGTKSGVKSGKSKPVAAYKRLAEIGDYTGALLDIGLDEDSKLVDAVLSFREKNAKAAKPAKPAKVSTLSAAVEEVTKTWDGIDWGFGAHEELTGADFAKKFLDKVEAVGAKSGVKSGKSEAIKAYKRLVDVGDYTGALLDIGVDEDSKLVDAILKARGKGTAKQPAKVKRNQTLAGAVAEVTQTWNGIDWGYAAHEKLVGGMLAKSFLNKVDAVGAKSKVKADKSDAVKAYTRMVDYGDYTGALLDIGVDEDSKIVDAVLSARGKNPFDSGGLGFGKGLLPKDIVEPERVLSPQQTRAFDDLVYKELPKNRGEGVTLVVNIDGEEVMRKRVDAVEGQVEVNANEIRKVKGDVKSLKTSSVVSQIPMMV